MSPITNTKEHRLSMTPAMPDKLNQATISVPHGDVQKSSSSKAAAILAARSVHFVREHCKMARTPLAAFFNIPENYFTIGELPRFIIKEDRMGKSLKDTKSHENLKAAFAGESQANRRYLYFAKRADIEGYTDIGGLFRDTSEAETGHAFGHLDFLKEVGDPATGVPIGNTDANLKAAIEGETYEYTQMYPGMAKTARDEGFEELAEWFETLAKAERSHANRFTKGLESLKEG